MQRLLGKVGAAFSMELCLFPPRLEGVCLGMQLAVVEFSRNVLGWRGKCALRHLFTSHLCISGGYEACCCLGDQELWRRAGLGSQHLMVCCKGAALPLEEQHGSST